MYCSNCGKDISNGQKFCSYCGATVITKSKENNDEIVDKNDGKNQNLWRIAVLGVVVVIIALIGWFVVQKLSHGGKGVKDIDIVSAAEEIYEDWHWAIFKQIKSVTMYYPRENGDEPYTVIADYNKAGDIIQIHIKSDNGEFDEIITLQYDEGNNYKNVKWINKGKLIKEIKYNENYKEEEIYYDKNEKAYNWKLYSHDVKFGGESTIYMREHQTETEYLYVYERVYERNEEGTTIYHRPREIYYRDNLVKDWDYLGERVLNEHDDVVKLNINFGETYHDYKYSYFYDADGNETGYEKYEDDKLIVRTTVEYFE